MSEEKKVVEFEETEETMDTAEVVNVEEKKSWPKRVLRFAVRHRKKLAVITTGVALTALGYVLGSRASNDANTDIDIDDSIELAADIAHGVTAE